MSYTLPASACPAPQLSLSPTYQQDDYVTGGLLPHGPIFNGDPAPGKHAADLNLMAGMVCNAYQTGGSPIHCVVSGLMLTGVGLTATVARGHATIGVLTDLYADAVGKTLNPDTTNYIWLYITGNVQVTTSTTAPTDSPCVYLGAMTTNGTSVTAVDYSGVFYNPGAPYRITADTSAPTDSPPTGCPPFDTLTTGGGIYRWNGASGTFASTRQAVCVTGETPSGAVDGNNTVFTLAHMPINGVGVYMPLEDVAYTLGRVDATQYTRIGMAITFATAPPAGGEVLVDYSYYA